MAAQSKLWRRNTSAAAKRLKHEAAQWRGRRKVRQTRELSGARKIAKQAGVEGRMASPCPAKRVALPIPDGRPPPRRATAWAPARALRRLQPPPPRRSPLDADQSNLPGPAITLRLMAARRMRGRSGSMKYRRERFRILWPDGPAGSSESHIAAGRQLQQFVAKRGGRAPIGGVTPVKVRDECAELGIGSRDEVVNPRRYIHTENTVLAHPPEECTCGFGAKEIANECSTCNSP